MKFSYYLLGQDFTLRTYHLSLRRLDSFHHNTTDVLAWWLHYLEPFRPYMTMMFRPGKNHGNADTLWRIDTRPCPSEDCPDHGHLLNKVKSPSENKPILLTVIRTRSQDIAGKLDNDSEVVPSWSDKEIKDAQKCDSELCRFMELLHEHTEKPPSKLLAGESPDVKVLCYLWCQFCVWNEILYHTGKEVEDYWRLVIPIDKRSEILSMLHDNKCAGHSGMSGMKVMVGTRFYWPCMRQDIENWIKCCQSCTMEKEDQNDHDTHYNKSWVEHRLIECHLMWLAHYP